MYNAKNIRNVALIGHTGEGKTSLLEAILFHTKAIDRLGKVDDGNTVSDSEPEEVARKMSINLSVAYTIYRDTKINFIDVPGFFDFEGEMISAMSACSSAIIVTTAQGVISVGAEKAVKYCIKNKIPAFLYINGVNRENSDYYKTREAFTTRFGSAIISMELPIFEDGEMTGFVDVLDNIAYDRQYQTRLVPTKISARHKQVREQLQDLSAEASDKLIEKVLAGEPLTAADMKEGLNIRVKQGEVLPVLGGVAVGNYFLTHLLDHIVDLMPSPSERDNPNAVDKNLNIVKIAKEETSFSAQIFKTIRDPFVGKLLLFRVFSGSVKIGDTIYNSTKKQLEKVSQLYVLRGKKQESISEVGCGDIAAFSKFGYTSTGDTLCAENLKIEYPKIVFPKPTIALAIRSAEKGLEDKVVQGLSKLMDEDATFKIEKSPYTGEMLVRGLGESQLEIMCQKLKTKYKVEAVLKEPQIAYRETIKKTIEQQGKYKKQSGGHGQYGDVYIRFSPNDGEECIFGEEIVGGSVPKQYFPAVEKGLKEACSYGVLAGYPMIGLKSILYFGSYHDVDSSEMAFVCAAKLAYKEGIPKASPILLEPMLSLKVIVPETYMGEVLGDLNKRRGKIYGMESIEEKSVINAEVPEAEMAKYATDLRSMTQGKGKFFTEFTRYEEVPTAISAKIIEKVKREQS